MVIYNLLGKEAEQAFTHSWGVSMGMGQASEWQNIASEAFKGLVILMVLDQLRLVPVGKWLERHLDILSVQAGLMANASEEGRLPTMWEKASAYKTFFSSVSSG